MWQKYFGPPDIENLKAQENVGGLIKALEYADDPEIRKEAALVLGSMRTTVAADALLVMLQEDNADGPRRAAAVALSQIRSEKAYIPFITALQDPDPGVRRIAVYGLGQLGQIKAIPFLFPFLEDDDLRSRKTATKALQRLGWHPDVSRGAAFYYINDEQWAACARVGTAAVAPLISVLVDKKQVENHGQVVWALGRIKDPSVVNPLATMLKDQRPEVRRMAAEALGNVGYGIALSNLLNALLDESEAVQFAATNSLNRLDLKGTEEDLRAAYQSKDPVIRQKAAELAVRLVETDALPLLEEALNDSHVGVRLQAVRALGHFGDQDRLGQALKDSEVSVRIMAVRVLTQLEDPNAQTHLTYALNDEDIAVRKEAVIRLGESKQSDRLLSLSNALTDKDATIRRLATILIGEIGDSQTIPFLLNSCHDPHPDVRVAGLEAMAKIGGTKADKAILSACLDGDLQVRKTAVHLLEHVSNENALASLLSALNDSSAAIRETAILSLATREEEKAFQALVNARWDADYRVSKTAVISLSNFGIQAIEPLNEALVDVNLPDLAAVQSLEKIGGPAVRTLLDALQINRLPARRAAANALARLLSSGEITKEQKNLILENRDIIVAFVDSNLIGIFPVN